MYMCHPQETLCAQEPILYPSSQTCASKAANGKWRARPLKGICCPLVLVCCFGVVHEHYTIHTTLGSAIGTRDVNHVKNPTMPAWSWGCLCTSRCRAWASRQHCKRIFSPAFRMQASITAAQEKYACVTFSDAHAVPLLMYGLQQWRQSLSAWRTHTCWPALRAPRQPSRQRPFGPWRWEMHSWTRAPWLAPQHMQPLPSF